MAIKKTTMTTSELKLKITVDENQLPHKIEWEAQDAKEGSVCKSMMLALWDEKENNTMRIDLWTHEMTVEEMEFFFYQTLASMADTYQRATNDDDMAKEMRAFAQRFGKEKNVLK